MKIQLSESARLYLESAARSIRAASRALDDAARASPRGARDFDQITGLDAIQIDLAERIERYAATHPADLAKIAEE